MTAVFHRARLKWPIVEDRDLAASPTNYITENHTLEEDLNYFQKCIFLSEIIEIKA